MQRCLLAHARSPAGLCAKNPKQAHALRARNAGAAVFASSSYNPAGFADMGPPQPPQHLHGVLHSTNLPDVLADSVGIYDARDAIETCAGLGGDDKAACYAVFGVAPAAEFWFDTVFHLEQALELETDPEEEAHHHGQERC